MGNTSATGGYLSPAVSPAPLQGAGLYNFVQELVVGITGMDGQYVRPAFQAEPPNIPDSGTAWCAIRIGCRIADTFPYIEHDSSGDGSDKMQRQELLEVFCSFFDLGVDGTADQLASLLRDGLLVAQNREVLQQNGWGLAATGDLQPAPVLVKQRWLYRVDFTFGLRRQIDRTYPVLNLESAGITAKDEGTALLTETINVTE